MKQENSEIGKKVLTDGLDLGPGIQSHPRLCWNSSSELQTATTIPAARSVVQKWARNLFLGPYKYFTDRNNTNGTTTFRLEGNK